MQTLPLKTLADSGLLSQPGRRIRKRQQSGKPKTAPPPALPAQPQRVLLVANTSWYLYNFRKPLLHDLQKQGIDVSLVAPSDPWSEKLTAAGFPLHPWLVARSSINPLREAHALLDLVRLYRREKPHLVHHFTIKACLYGTIAAKIAGVPRVINAVTGLGHVFLGERRRTRALRFALKPLYRAVFSARRSTVVFQNADDQEQLIRLGITNPERARMIRSSGVDIHHFSLRSFCESTPTSSASRAPFAAVGSDPLAPARPIRLLFPSRLIAEKGISELLEACRSLWAEGLSMELLIAGELDDGNRSCLSAGERSALQREAQVRCLGHVHDMRSVYSQADLVVLPSYREGLSRALIEAAAMERPIITTDVPGCRDVVDHGLSGLLVPLKDGQAIRRAIELLIHNPALAAAFGRAARQKVINEFRVGLINEQTITQYRRLLQLNPGAAQQPRQRPSMA